MNAKEQQIYEDVQKDFDYIVALRRYFHQHPELSTVEFHTADKIEEELDKIGISHTRVGDTGVYAEIKGNLPGDKTILLRADIDALSITETNDISYKSVNEGIMHACGHDAHTACLLGAARVLVKNKALFGGTIRLAFQSGEEIGYGARIFVDNGYVDGADRTFGIHVASNVASGSVVVMPGANNASVDWFKINVEGKAAHVSTPELGIDAAYIASQILVAIQALVTRRINPMDNALIGVGKLTAGTAYNIVASHAELEGTVRVFSPEIRKQIHDQIELTAANIAKSFGGEITFEWKDFTSPLINDATSTIEAQETAISLFGNEQVIKSRTPALGGDDFAEFINCVPGVYAYIGSANKSNPNTCAAHHTPNFDIDENSLLTGTAFYAAYAVDFLEN